MLPRDSEVEQLHAGRRQDDVGGLQVGVNDAGMMGSVETVGDLGAVLERLTERYGPLGKPVGECFAVEKLHDQVVDAIVTTDIMHCADVRVIESRDRTRFVLEPFTPSWIAAGITGDDLDRDGAIEARVGGAVDLPHAARVQGRRDLIRAEPRPRRKAHRLELFRHRQAFDSPRAEDQRHRSDADAVVVGKRHRAGQQRFSEKRAILAAKILEHRSGSGQNDARVPPRDSGEVEPYGRIRIASDDALALSKTDVAG